MSGTFRSVNKQSPCPACGKPDWCAWTAKGWLKCERATTPPEGMRLVSRKSSGALFAPTSSSTSTKAHARLDWAATSLRCLRALPHERRDELAHQLGVDPDSLTAIGIGWASLEDLRSWRASGKDWDTNFPGGAYTFPERDGGGRVVGLGLRATDGRKGFPSGTVGARRGLIIPTNLKDRPDPVLVVEGASDVAAAITAGLAVVGRPSSHGGVEDLAVLLHGRDTLVVGERDQKSDGRWPGRDGAKAVAAGLAGAWRRTVRWSMPPEGIKDIRAWLQHRMDEGMGGTDAGSKLTVGQEILGDLGTVAALALADSNEAPPTSAPDAWPAPKPMTDALPPVQPFDAALLPSSLRAWIVDIAQRVQCPIDFPAVAAMVALATLVGRKVGIRPKREDDWTVVPNLWGAVIGRPGVMKSPALQEPLRPLRRFEVLAKQEYDAACAAAEADELVAEARKKDKQHRIKKSLKDPQEAKRIAMESLDDDGETPVRRRYITNDSTVEKLGETLNENPNGVLVFRDELVGFLKGLDKEGQEGARSFYLEAWNGTGRYTYDRIGRGTVDIEAAIVSVLGGIQPGPLSQYLRGAAREGASDDGLIQRFQLIVWPDIDKEWKNVDRWPDSAARTTANLVFEGMDVLEASLIGADNDPSEADNIPFLRFTDDAQVLFDGWRGVLEREVRSGELHPALESHLAKYRSLIPTLALLIHLAEGRRGAVTAGALRKAIAWGVYLRSHAERLYSQAIHPDVAAARALAKRLLGGEIKDGFALRDIYRNGWSGLSTPQEAQGAIDVLLAWEWLTEVQVPGAGRTGLAFYINPRIHELPAPKNCTPLPEGTDKADRSPPPVLPHASAPPSGSSVSAAGGGSAVFSSVSGEGVQLPEPMHGPPGDCYACGQRQWWSVTSLMHWTCGGCHPPPNLNGFVIPWIGNRGGI